MDRDKESTCILLRDANLSDGPFVVWLEEVCMKDYAVALWGHWRPSSELADLDLSNHQIIELGGISVGCVALNWSDDCLFLARLFVAPDYRNRGIGAHVLRKVVQLATDKSIPIRLSVLKTNPGTSFYQREGFALEEETTERRKLIKRTSDKDQ